MNALISGSRASIRAASASSTSTGLKLRAA
jgi:hypothetical protein